jgi:putative chitinase
MLTINKEKYMELYQAACGKANHSQYGGIISLLDALMADENVTDIRHAAYMLATTKHETAKTWQPIEEYGKGKGYKYGNPDIETGEAYYGRGYVQLTWAANYISMGRALNIDLYHHPELALDPKVAYEIMSLGMRRGSFTGKRLKDYINADECDYLHARKIINGMDCAERIAGYATAIEGILHQVV